MPRRNNASLSDVAAYAARRETHKGSPAKGEGGAIAVVLAGSDGPERLKAARALAKELRRELDRVDSRSLAGKSIGETEKDLGGRFDAAERTGAILLFDEADALFGKRGRAKDSHDRYANTEMSYLLQRLETHSGLVLFLTDTTDQINDSFMRHIRFVLRAPSADDA